jgi:hypothetical protein
VFVKDMWSHAITRVGTGGEALPFLSGDGNFVTFVAAASGTPTPTVQWEVSTDGGTSYRAIDGATTGTLAFTATAAENGYLYAAVFTNVAGYATRVGQVGAYLNAATIDDDGAWDVLSGGPGRDLFFQGVHDLLAGRHANEQVLQE